MIIYTCLRKRKMSTFPSSPDPLFTFRPRSGAVTSVQFSRISETPSVLTGTSSGNICLWDLKLKRQYWTRKQNGNIVSLRCIRSKGKDSIVSLLKEGTLSIWDVETGLVSFETAIHNPGFCNFCVIDNDKPSIVLADREYGRMSIFDFSMEKVTTHICTKEPRARGMCLCTSVFEDGGIKHIIAGFEDGKISYWDIRMPEREVSSLEVFSEPVMCIDYSTVIRQGVCGSPLNTLETFTFTLKDGLTKAYSVAVKNSGIASVKIREDGRIMACGGWDGRIRVFGCKKGKPLAALNFHTDVVQCLCFAPSDDSDYPNLMICGSKDQRISLWKIY